MTHPNLSLTDKHEMRKANALVCSDDGVRFPWLQVAYSLVK